MPDKKDDVIEIPVGKYLGRIRENPWMIASIILGLLFLGSLVFGFNGSDAASESIVSGKVMSFLESQVDSPVVLKSIDNKGSYYELIVEYQGNDIPVYATLDGQNLISDLVPLADSGNDAPPGKVDVTIPEDAHVEGDPDAPVTIVEFSDFECPFCARFYSDTLGKIRENYIDTGKAKLVYMHFPLGFHPEAMPAAVASECAGEQGKFFEMHDKLFEGQAELGRENYIKWAGELGLDNGKFTECLDSGKFDGKISAEAAYGSSIGVSGTPGFFINGQKVDGAQPYSVFERIIESELE